MSIVVSEIMAGAASDVGCTDSCTIVVAESANATANFSASRSLKYNPPKSLNRSLPTLAGELSTWSVVSKAPGAPKNSGEPNVG